MLTLRTRLAILVCLCAGALPGAGAAQPHLRAGSEFQVNSHTDASQGLSAVGVSNDGDFVVAWGSGSQDGSGYGVFARRFDSGVAQGAEFQINVYTPGSQHDPAVGMDGDGDFVVAWRSFDQDGSSYGIFARRFNSAGVALGLELQVNAFTTAQQSLPEVGMDDDGDFVVAWMSYEQDGSSYGIFAQRFDAAGTAQSDEFQVNTNTVSSQGFFGVDMGGDGGFVVVWGSSDGQDGSGYGVFAQRFDDAGTALGDEFQVNVYTSGDQAVPRVGIASDGDFVVVWRSFGQDGSSNGIFARRFDSGGIAQSAEFQVNIYTTGGQGGPAVGVESDGDFVVAWGSFGQDGSADYSVFARPFDANGNAQAAEFEVNSYTEYRQSNPAIGMASDGDFVVTWRSDGQDGSSIGVFAQRYQVPAVLDIDGNGSVDPLTDGILVLRYLFGFSEDALVAGAVDEDGCTRCGAADIEAYLATMI